MEVAYGEPFAALVKGLQGALWELGGVPEVVRTDNLSAATHELKGRGGRALNERYAVVLAHYGLRSTRTNPRPSHGNGVAEQGHHRSRTRSAGRWYCVAAGTLDRWNYAKLQSLSVALNRLSRIGLAR